MENREGSAPRRSEETGATRTNERQPTTQPIARRAGTQRVPAIQEKAGLSEKESGPRT